MGGGWEQSWCGLIDSNLSKRSAMTTPPPLTSFSVQSGGLPTGRVDCHAGEDLGGGRGEGGGP